MKILINGYSAVTGGGATVLRDFVEGANIWARNTSTVFHTVIPDSSSFLGFQLPNLIFHDRHSLAFSSNSVIFNEFGLDYFCKNNSVDAVINFGDLIPRTRTPQLYFFDWAYLLYPESTVWNSMSFRNWFQRSTKAFLIRRRLERPLVIIVQCEAMKRRMEQWSKADVITIPSPCRFQHSSLRIKNNYDCMSPILNLLVLSGYAPHKNFSLIRNVGKIIDSKNLPLKITLTIAPESSEAALAFLREVEQDGLGHVITNIGNVPYERVPDIISEHDAILLPTLLESYCLPYVEGMQCGKTIFTSDLDFARSVCGEAAFYFNPFSAQSVVETITNASSCPYQRSSKIKKGFTIVDSLPNLAESSKRIIEAIVERLR